MKKFRRGIVRYLGMEPEFLSEEVFKDILLELPELLTAHQLELFTLYFIEGLTQCQIAEKLKIHQTSVHKGLFGNLAYSVAGIKLSRPVLHGGLFKKLEPFLVKKIEEVTMETQSE